MHRYIADGTVPKPFKIGRMNAWILDDVEAAIEALAAGDAAPCQRLETT